CQPTRRPCTAARQYGSGGCTGDTCPTCRGTGRIPRGQEDMLVAVIPCNDVRLKPQRTKLYVCLSMGLCLVISCLILYFLFPRAVVLVPVYVQSVTVYFTPEAVSLEVTNLINISNENFFPVQIVELDIQGLISKTIMGKSKQCNVTHLDARSQLLVSGAGGDGFPTFCQSKTIPIHTLFLELQITMQVSYLSHNEQLSMNIYEYIDCGNNSTVPHLPA
uniref:Transmembrane protein 106A n=1 Tax=Gadus morhua TaxID=8049 RepID=A0A8C4ZMU5_GADMO